MDLKNFYVTETPMCDDNVIDMSYMYYGQANLIGSPVCGKNVKNMNHAYCQCINISGEPVCGDNVVEMDCTYYNCKNLSGCAVSGPNVISMSGTYTNCTNISNNAYFYSPNINYVGGCFSGKDNSKRLNIYVPENSITLSSCLSEDYAFSLIAQNITWVYDEYSNCHYNDIYNIYIYPVQDVQIARMQNNDN